jgi:hypothetical protein
VADDKLPAPDADLDRFQSKARVREAIKTLPERERA